MEITEIDQLIADKKAMLNLIVSKSNTMQAELNQLGVDMIKIQGQIELLEEWKAGSLKEKHSSPTG